MSDIVSRLRDLSAGPSWEIEKVADEAADEIESLRQKTQYWPDNAERDAVIRHQKEEIERLRSENQKAAVEYLGQIGQLSDEITRLREWNAEIALNARHFAEALRKIADHPTGGVGCNPEGFVKDARAALGRD